MTSSKEELGDNLGNPGTLRQAVSPGFSVRLFRHCTMQQPTLSLISSSNVSSLVTALQLPWLPQLHHAQDTPASAPPHLLLLGMELWSPWLLGLLYSFMPQLPRHQGLSWYRFTLEPNRPLLIPCALIFLHSTCKYIMCIYYNLSLPTRMKIPRQGFW